MTPPDLETKAREYAEKTIPMPKGASPDDMEDVFSSRYAPFNAFIAGYTARVGEEQWRPISEAPKNATWVLLLVKRPGGGLPSTQIVHAHWAHGGGEEQPAFGPAWFRDTGHDFAEVSGEILGWHPAPHPSPTALEPLTQKRIDELLAQANPHSHLSRGEALAMLDEIMRHRSKEGEYTERAEQIVGPECFGGGIISDNVTLDAVRAFKDRIAREFAAVSDEATRRERERCAGIAREIAARNLASACRATTAGRMNVASHRETDATTADEIAAAILSPEKG